MSLRRAFSWAWVGAALCLVGGGCTNSDLPGPEAGGGDGASGSGGSSGGAGGHGGAGGSGGGLECAVGEARCAGNRPQRCAGSGQWEDDAPCGENAPVCSGGVCGQPPSCMGLGATCGTGESCCASGVVPGGTFNRSTDINAPATVSDFRLDRFEITVGRFRKFVEAYPGSKPMAGAGQHPNPAIAAESGWKPEWNANLPADNAALRAAVKCDSSLQTWTDEAGLNEDLPMNCISWFVTFAFCAWDGGRLPTEAEWNYAAAGGDQQRTFPWGDAFIDPTLAAYGCIADGSELYDCSLQDILRVGSRSPAGDARWHQADMAGNIWEWTLDWYATPYTPMCDDCANLVDASDRVVRGGSFRDSETATFTDVRFNYTPSLREVIFGSRCARTP